MRKHLMETFDKIYILDLHGNAKKKETAKDGSKDENVFDIQQGVSINIFIKTGMKQSNELAKVYHAELLGVRENKFEYLNNNEFDTVEYKELEPVEPYYFFVPKDFNAQADYDKGFKIDELFVVNTSGVKTHHDDELVSMQPFDTETNREYCYRPFDKRYINYDLNKVVRHRYSVMKHFEQDNIGITTCRNQNFETSALITNVLSDIRYFSCPGSIGSDYVYPLYLYDDSEQKSFFDVNRKPNLNMDIVQTFETALGLSFTPEKENTESTFAPIDILDYIYGILHSNKYRTKYKEFLKIDFPRIPYPTNKDYFFNVAELGKRLREIHLMEAPEVMEYITSYSVSGDNEVIKPKYKENKVYINHIQYFDNVPEVAWNFYIGGYQPAQKWLKDRKGRILSYDEILHYQKIIKALVLTNDRMQQIDKIIEV